jgi:1-acyl-sn-glycerol-3-phosphate acyltransferase
MTTRLRAAGRLLRCVLHGVHGVLIVLLRFGTLPITKRQWYVQWWAIKTLRLLDITLRVEGAPVAGAVLLVANHISWLDIMALHAVCPHARFVSKADVKSWPLMRHLVDAADTLYLERERKRDALRVVHAMAEALKAGDTVAIFPEGTTSDGQALLPFHANLLQAAIATETPVQPVAIRFSDSTHTISRAVEFVGATTLARSLWRVASGNELVVRVALLPSRATAQADRRALAEQLRGDIAAALAA